MDGGLYPGQDLFALKIQGHSMKAAGILDQDIAICTPRQYAQNREIVVALIRNEEATVKRFFLHPDFIELRPENPDFKSQNYAFDDILVQGKVIGIWSVATRMAGEEDVLRVDHEFLDDTNDVGRLRAALYSLAETLGRSLRRQNWVSKQVALVLSYSDGCHQRVCVKLTSPTANEMRLFTHVTDLMFRAWTRRIRIRHLCLTNTTRIRPEIQASLFALPVKEENQEKILRIVDKIRAKFGVNAIRTGLTLEEPISPRF